MRAELKSQADLGLGAAEVTILITRPDGAIDELHVSHIDLGSPQDSEFNLLSSMTNDNVNQDICLPQMDEFALSLKIRGRLVKVDDAELFTMTRIQDAPESEEEPVEEEPADPPTE